jgi:hypothetical protein
VTESLRSRTPAALEELIARHAGPDRTRTVRHIGCNAERSTFHVHGQPDGEEMLVLEGPA